MCDFPIILKYRKNKQHDKIIELLPFDNMEGTVSR